MRDVNRKRCSISFSEPSLTKQAHKDECDINRVMKRWLRDGVMTHVSEAAVVFRDVSADVDYHSVMNQVLDVEDAFASLPSATRKRFANDPLNLLDFIMDPSNADEASDLGLLVRPVEAPDFVAAAVPDAAPES